MLRYYDIAGVLARSFYETSVDALVDY